MLDAEKQKADEDTVSDVQAAAKAIAQAINDSEVAPATALTALLYVAAGSIVFLFGKNGETLETGIERAQESIAEMVRVLNTRSHEDGIHPWDAKKN